MELIERKLNIWIYKCSCWNICEANIYNVNAWRKKSCWCLRSIINRERYLWNTLQKTHWMSWTRIYNVYYWILQRCNNSNHVMYKNYWWRWIENLWNTFEEFYKDMWDSYKDWLQLDRINNNWNYCKDNCRWITPKQNSNNRRNNRLLTYKWKTKTLSEFADIYWIKYRVLQTRLNYWWTLDRALTQKVRKYN